MRCKKDIQKYIIYVQTHSMRLWEKGHTHVYVLLRSIYFMRLLLLVISLSLLFIRKLSSFSARTYAHAFVSLIFS